MVVQPPNSPETNVLDLCIFRSWARRNHKFQKHCRNTDIAALVANVNRSWDEYPSDILERGFCNKSLALDCIIEMKGGNHFSIPHLTPEQRTARLPPLPP